MPFRDYVTKLAAEQSTEKPIEALVDARGTIRVLSTHQRLAPDRGSNAPGLRAIHANSLARSVAWKPAAVWLPSQNGFCFDAPQRQSVARNRGA